MKNFKSILCTLSLMCSFSLFLNAQSNCDTTPDPGQTVGRCLTVTGPGGDVAGCNTVNSGPICYFGIVPGDT